MSCDEPPVSEVGIPDRSYKEDKHGPVLDSTTGATDIATVSPHMATVRDTSARLNQYKHLMVPGRQGTPAKGRCLPAE